MVEGATRTVTPRSWHCSTRSTAISCGKSGSAMITSWTRACSSGPRQVLDASQRAQPVLRVRLERDVADHLDRRVGGGAQRVGHRVDLGARAHQQRPALVAGGAQQQPGHAVIGPAEERHVEDREDQRPVEDVVAGEALAVAVDQREDERDERDLEQAGDDAAQPRAFGPVRVEVRAREEQGGDEVGERDRALRLAQHGREVLPALERPP